MMSIIDNDDNEKRIIPLVISSRLRWQILFFLGVADDSKVVAKLKCNIWFQLHTKQMDVSLSDRSSCEVKYFVRYLCHIPIIIFS